MPSGTELPWYAALPESGDGSSVRWTSGAFEAELREWVGGVLGGLGTDLVSLDAVHQRPWSTVWRGVASDGATYWAKQNCPQQSFEAALLVVLDRLSPHRVVPVVAADVERGLHLVPDQGPVFALTVADDDVDAWCRLAAEAMHLQRELVGHEADLLGAGITALPPAESAAYVEARVASLTALAPDDPRRMADDVAHRLRALLPAVTAWADDVGVSACGRASCTTTSTPATSSRRRTGCASSTSVMPCSRTRCPRSSSRSTCCSTASAPPRTTVG